MGPSTLQKHLIGLRVLGQIRKHHSLTKDKEREALGLIERFLYAKDRRLRLEARRSLVFFGEQGSPVWRRILRSRRKLGYSYSLSQLLSDMRLLKKDALPLVPQLLELLSPEWSGAYWNVLSVFQAMKQEACAPLMSEVRELGMQKGSKAKIQRSQFLWSMARISPTCVYEWGQLLRAGRLQQKETLEAIRKMANNESLAFLRILLPLYPKIFPENRVLWESALLFLIQQFHSRAWSSLHACSRSRSSSFQKRQRLWKQDELVEVIGLLRAYLKEALSYKVLVVTKNKSPRATYKAQALLRYRFYSRHNVQSMRNRLFYMAWLVLRSLSLCVPKERTKLYLWLLSSFEQLPPHAQSYAMAFLSSEFSAHVSQTRERFLRGKTGERRLAFRLLATRPKLAKFSVAELLEALSGDDGEGRLAAMLGLRHFREEFKGAVPAVFSWAEKAWEPHLRPLQKKLAVQAVSTLTAVGFSSKEALDRCVGYWKKIEGCSSSVGCHIPMYVRQMGNSCAQALCSTKAPWKVYTAEQWLSLLEALPTQRWSFLSFFGIFLKESPQKEKFWMGLFRMAKHDVGIQQRILQIYTQQGPPESLGVLWLALLSPQEGGRQFALQILQNANFKDPKLRAWLFALAKSKEGQSPSMRGLVWRALGQVGRDDLEVLRFLLGRLWKAPPSDQATLLRSLRYREDDHCLLTQELLEFYSKTAQQKSSILAMLAEQKKCLRYGFPKLWKVSLDQTDRLRSFSGAQLKNLFHLSPKAIVPFFVGLSFAERQQFWRLTSPQLVGSEQALRDWFGLLDDPLPVIRDFAERFLRQKIQARFSHYTTYFGPLFQELAHPNKKHRALAMGLLTSYRQAVYLVQWLSQKKSRRKKLRLFFHVLPELSKSSLTDALYFLGSLGEVAQEALGWALLHPRHEVRFSAVVSLQRLSMTRLKALLPVLNTTLERGTFAERKLLLSVLWKFKLADPLMRKVFVGLLRSHQREVRWGAAKLLARLGEKSSISSLREMLGAPLRQTRLDAAQLMTYLERHVSLLLPMIREALEREKYTYTSVSLLYAIAGWGRKLEPLRDLLERKLQSKRYARYMLWPLARLLGNMGPKASWAVPVLWREMRKTSVYSYHSTPLAQSLGQIGVASLDEAFAYLRAW